MRPAAGGPTTATAAGATHVFTIRAGRAGDDTRAYKTRKPHSKSKTGCGACKAKRVKCGEERPACVRCVRSKAECVYEGGDGPAHAPLHPPPPRPRPAAIALPSATPLPRLPTSLSRTPLEQSLMKHYDVVTSQPLDTITFSNILAGERSPHYRALVLDQAKRHPHLMHSMLAVSALHLNHYGNKQYRRPGLAHLQVALPKFRQSVAGPISPQESPHILYSAMLITLHYFAITSRAVTDSWVFSSSPDRLDWLTVSQGLAPLFGATRQHHTDTFMTPVFRIVEGDRAADRGLPPSMLELCGWTPAATPDELRRNPYVAPLQQLNALLPLEHTVPHVLKYLRFMADFDKRFSRLIAARDPRALLIMAYGFALMCDVELWWTQPRARRDCWAICSYLDTLGDRNIRPHLGFPARACGYESTFGPSGFSLLEELPGDLDGAWEDDECVQNFLDEAGDAANGHLLS